MMRLEWAERWSEFAAAVRGRVDCDLRWALRRAASDFDLVWCQWFADDVPVGVAGGGTMGRFVDEVERDLALESMEADGEPATFAEFIEAVARQVDQVICQHRSLWSLASPHETVSGVRQATLAPHVLSVWALFLRRYAQWLGEGVGRAGEEIPRPVVDPGWTPGDGDFPWSMPKSKRRSE